jgi:hypothetical protein
VASYWLCDDRILFSFFSSIGYNKIGTGLLDITGTDTT